MRGEQGQEKVEESECVLDGRVLQRRGELPRDREERSKRLVGQSGWWGGGGLNHHFVVHRGKKHGARHVGCSKADNL